MVILMNRIKIILRVFLGFGCSVFMFILAFLLIIRVTIYNKNYVLKKLDEINYYEKVYLEISNDMKNNLLSSGLDETILENLFTENDVLNDINGLIGSIYSGSKYEVDTAYLKDKLNKNIKDYLNKNNTEVTDQKALDKFISNIISIYKKEISLYGHIEGYTNKFIKVGKFIDVSIVVITFLLIIFLVILRWPLHRKYEGVISLSAGMMLLYFKFYIYEQIDMKNILIISDSFSKLIKELLLDINNYIFILAIILLFVGIFLNFVNSFKKVKRRKKIS